LAILTVNGSLAGIAGCFKLCITASMITAAAGTSRIELTDGTVTLSVFQPNSEYLRADSLATFLRRRSHCKCCASVEINAFRSFDPAAVAFCQKFCRSAFVPTA